MTFEQWAKEQGYFEPVAERIAQVGWNAAMSSQMTVREAFEKAYGSIPEGATCHVGYTYFDQTRIRATHGHNGNVYTHIDELHVWQGDNFDNEVVIEPDISDRPAEAFRGFFGPEYDEVLA